MIKLKTDGLEMDGGIKGVINAIAASAGEFGFEFLTITFGIEEASGAAEFVSIDHTTLRCGELKSSPIGIGFRVFEVIEEMIVTFGSTDEESAAVAVTERGIEDFRPSFGPHRGEFIKDDEVEAVATERVGTVGATDGDGGAECEVNGEVGLGGEFGPIGTSEFLEAGPGDAFGLSIGGGDVPDSAAFDLGGMEHFGESEVGFAETAASDEDAETGGGIEDEHLVETEAQDVRGNYGAA